jgi:hypothetical protein
MVVVRRYVCHEQHRVIWVATDRTEWHVWWGPDGGPYEHRWPDGEAATRTWVAELRHRGGGVWVDITHRTGG